jgi:hypothetical protein
VIKLDDGAIHPVDSVVVETPGVTREAHVHVDAFSQRYGRDALLTPCSSITVEDGTVHVYVHVDPGQSAGRLMSARLHPIQPCPTKRSSSSQ